jgi:hypothetical protein
MSEHAIIISGIPIFSDDPVFLGILVVHVVGGLVCVIAGIVAMLSRKCAGRHPTAGSIYYWSLSAVFVRARGRNALQKLSKRRQARIACSLIVERAAQE